MRELEEPQEVYIGWGWLKVYIKYCFIRLAIANHEGCHFKFRNQTLDLSVIGGQSGDALFFMFKITT